LTVLAAVLVPVDNNDRRSASDGSEDRVDVAVDVGEWGRPRTSTLFTVLPQVVIEPALEELDIVLVPIKLPGISAGIDSDVSAEEAKERVPAGTGGTRSFSTLGAK
jgi:hypothetical protein